MSISFKKKVEDFKCEHCGQDVKGNGYTNHCPSCLWSKHVDINPGDRMEKCGGLMEPVSCENISGETSVSHKCVSCGTLRRNKVSKTDNLADYIDKLDANFREKSSV